jgi:hypothetical protein
MSSADHLAMMCISPVDSHMTLIWPQGFETTDISHCPKKVFYWQRLRTISVLVIILCNHSTGPIISSGDLSRVASRLI